MPYVGTITGQFEIHKDLAQYDMKICKIMMAIMNMLNNFCIEKYVFCRYYMDLHLIFKKLVKHHF